MTTRADTIYSGWWVLAGCFISALMVIGGSIYVFQLFVLPITEEFNITRGEANNAFIALMVGIAIWSPILGRLYDHVSVRVLMPIGGLSYAAGLLLIAASQSLYIMLLAIFLCLGPAMVLAGGLAANTVTTRWFKRRLGRALGIAAIASSAGGFIMVPITTILIESFSWRFALSSVGIAVGTIIVALGLLVVKDRPSDQDPGKALEFKASDNQEMAVDQEPLWTFGRLLKSLNFWLIILGVGLLLASDQAILTSQYIYFVDIGFTAAQAASIITAMTGSAIVGKLIVGFLAEKYDIRILYALVALFHILLLVMFLVQPGYVAMLVFASIFGAAVGGIYPVWSVLCSSTFGSASFGVVFGANALFGQILGMSFVAYIGYSFDQNASYNAAFYTFIGAVVLGLCAIAALRPNSGLSDN